ncbi:MAG TPA: CDP-alcohol phosphatidyltransferase family protein [Steroidobacteraceae bacterium]|jgi:archaetidylinositol phosphate synthase|nr:CDP-alcohol phosphatidyltransferase family protein [Steroidobacteraceae bacterium]
MAVTRVNENLLGGLERPVLAFLADALPGWVVPDHLTALGVVGAVLTAAGFILSRWSLSWLWLASVGLILNWLGDSLDGTVARRRGIERPRYGFFIDHTTDMLSQALIFLSLGLSPCAHFGVACVGLIAFLMMFVYTLIGAHVRDVMQITYLGFGATEIRALLLIGNLLILAFGILHLQSGYAPLSLLGSFSGHDVAICVISLTAAVVIILSTVREARTLAALDPTPGAMLGPK